MTDNKITTIPKINDPKLVKKAFKLIKDTCLRKGGPTVGIVRIPGLIYYKDYIDNIRRENMILWFGFSTETDGNEFIDVMGVIWNEKNEIFHCDNGPNSSLEDILIFLIKNQPVFQIGLHDPQGTETSYLITEIENMLREHYRTNVKADYGH